MSAIESSVSASIAPSASLGTLTKPTQFQTQPKAVEKSAPSSSKSPSTIGQSKIGHSIGPFGISILLSGICVAVGGTLWAVELDVPYPLAIMAGYCTFIVSASLCAVLMLLRKTPAKVDQPVSSATANPTNAATPAAVRGKPNYAAWKLVSKFSVSDASRLWCDIEPGCPATQESIAWAHAILDAIKRGELTIIPRSGLSEAM